MPAGSILTRLSSQVPLHFREPGGATFAFECYTHRTPRRCSPDRRCRFLDRSSIRKPLGGSRRHLRKLIRGQCMRKGPRRTCNTQRKMSDNRIRSSHLHRTLSSGVEARQRLLLEGRKPRSIIARNLHQAGGTHDETVWYI